MHIILSHRVKSPLQTEDYPWLVSLVTADSSRTVLPSTVRPDFCPAHGKGKE
jgi:hypothetical protein